MHRAALALVLTALLFATANSVRAEGPTHTVTYGETLYSIARRYGVSPQSLASANGIPINSWVYVGQRLDIPGAGSSSSAKSQEAQTSPSGIYTVRAGDTLYGVARAFGVSVQALADLNDIPANGMLYTGWQLRIPGKVAPLQPAASAGSKSAAPQPTAAAKSHSPEESTTLTYIVQPGDTLYGISIRYNVSPQAVVLANNLTTRFVYSGQRLVIPGAPSASQLAVPQELPGAAGPAKPIAGQGVRLQGFPVYRQKQTLTCEESAAAMALKGELTEKQIVNAMPRSDNPFEGIRGNPDYPFIGGLTHYGTYAHGLQKGLAKLGRQSTTYYGQPYDVFKQTILDHLNAGRPVIWWTTWRESHQKPRLVQVSSGLKVSLVPYEHTVLITGADARGVTYHDPYDGTVRFTSWENHKRTSGYFNNMALVIY